MNADQPRNPTRREAIVAGIASAGALALGGRATAAQDDARRGPYGPFKMGLQSYSLRHFKLHEAMKKTRELGLHYWESFPAHIPSDPADAASQYEHAEEHGVHVIGFGVIHFSRDRDACRAIFEFGKAMKLGYFSADPDPDAFDVLDRLVEEYGIAVGIHNHGPGHRYDKVDTIAKAIRDHHKLVGCCIDTGHFLRSREDPVHAMEVFDDRIYGVHLKDVKDATEFTVLGKGDLRTADLLKGLASRKYEYCLALEYEEHPEAPMDEIRACLAAVREAASGL